MMSKTRFVLEDDKPKQKVNPSAARKTREIVLSGIILALVFSIGYLLVDVVKSLFAEFTGQWPVIFADGVVAMMLLFAVYLLIHAQLRVERNNS